MKIGTLKNGINGLFANRHSRITAKTLFVYGNYEWDEIRAALKNWQEKGFLEILVDPEKTEDNDDCIEVFCYIID